MILLKKCVRFITDLYFLVAVAALVALIILNTVEIFSRYFLNASIIWVQEFSLLLICWVIFLGFGTVFVEKQDIAITFLVDRLKQRYQYIVRIVQQALTLITAAYLLVQSVRLLQHHMGKTTLIMHIPQGYHTLPLVMVLVLLSVQAFVDLIDELTIRTRSVNESGGIGA